MSSLFSRVPQYFFHTQDGHLVCDDEGVELRDLAAAKAQAVIFLGELLRASREFWAEESLKVIVTTGGDEVVYEIAAIGSQPADTRLQWPPQTGPPGSPDGTTFPTFRPK